MRVEIAEQATNEAKACENTDREIWRETPGDYYAPSIHVTKEGGAGIDAGGLVIVMDVRDWHRLAAEDRYPLMIMGEDGTIHQIRGNPKTGGR